jgi:CO dehydrogenase maturation factor
MEHLSRRTTRDVQHLIIVTDPTQRGLLTAERIATMRHELEIGIGETHLIVNRLNGEMPEPLQERIKQMQVALLGTVPADRELAEFEFTGKPLVELGDESPVYAAVAEMMGRLFSP